MIRNRHQKGLRFLGFFGFFGFLGFQYFVTHNISALSFFAYFGFFSYFWIAKIANDMVDERYIENARNAKAFTFHIAILEFIVLYLITPLHFINKEIITVISALCFASLIIIYAIAFYQFEKK